MSVSRIILLASTEIEAKFVAKLMYTFEGERVAVMAQIFVG